MKAAEMPMNTIAIIILVIVVIVALLGFFLGVWGPGTKNVSYESAKNTACLKLVATGCGDPAGILIDDPDIVATNLEELCLSHYNADIYTCKKLCGCSG